MNFNNIRRYIAKGNRFLRKNILFLNINNKNIKDLAYRDYCYKKLYKKYSYVLKENEKNTYPKERENSEYVWILWFQGIENAPDLVKKCYESVKKYLPNRNIIIINEKNYKDYIEIPEYIEQKRKKGLITMAHFSDIIRVKLLNKYGGLWIDATVYLTNAPDNVLFENKLFVYKEVSLNPIDKLPISASSWLIYSCRNNNILNLTEKLLLEYWKREHMLLNYYLFHLFFTMATIQYSDEWNEIPTIPNVNPHILQFELNNDFDKEKWRVICKMSNIHKLNYRIENSNDNSFYNYLIKGNLNETQD